MPPVRPAIDRSVDEAVENEWLGLGDTTQLRVPDPLALTVADKEDPLAHLVKVLRDPSNFFFTCKHVLGLTMAPFQLAILHEMWVRSFPMLIASRGASKTFLLSVYILLRMLLCPGVKIVAVGAAFRQSKLLFEYCIQIWNSAPVLRDICRGSDNGPKVGIDRCSFIIGGSVAHFIPIGDGSKIRGLRANIIIGDEFASISSEIFENVISGFAAVSMAPVEKMRTAAKLRALKRLGYDQGDSSQVPGLSSNQTVISGTAYYSFNHFYSYWRRWKAIVESRGDRRKLEEIFGGEVPPSFNHADYSVIRIPYELLPEGFMDEKHVAKAKATIHTGQFLMEFSAAFSGDSNGFFKRTLVESCVAGKPDAPIVLAHGRVEFSAMLRGDPSRRYAIAVDPASEVDNCSIVVLELWPDHRRTVHCWTTTRRRHKAKLGKGLAEEADFYAYVARRIRSLMELFPCDRLAIDKQGGGIAILEELADPSRLKEGEKLILPVVVDDDPQPTDGMAGDHIVEVVQFARADWVSEANHGLRKDMEDKALLFPAFDSAILGLSMEADRMAGRVKETPDGDEKLYDTLEDCMMEIEELKDELATIVHTQTGTSMRDRWDTPEVKLPGGKKGRLRKDRYSALLMANMAARVLSRTPEKPAYAFAGVFAHDALPSSAKPRWNNPDWYEKAAGPGYGAVVKRV